MRKNRREIAAVFAAFAVILAAGVSSTTQMPVVCAEEEHDNEADDLTAQEENDQTTDQEATGDDVQGGSENTTGSDVQDGANNRTGAGTDEDADGTGSATGGADGDYATDVGTGTSDDDTDADMDTANVPDDAGDEIEEDEMLLTSAASTFLLGNSRSSEITWRLISGEADLNSLLEGADGETPVRAILSDNITVEQPIQLSKKLILELDNHTISASSTVMSVEKEGLLTITNSGVNGTLKSEEGPVITVTGGGLVMNDGGVTAESGNAIHVSRGSVKISGGMVRGNNCAIYMDGGEVVVSGGTVEAASSTDVHAIHVNSGNLTVSGGYIIANGEAGSGSLCIQGGSAEITGGNFETSVNGDYGYACYVVGNGGITIKGGNFELSAPGGKSLYIDTSGAVSVSGGIYNNSIGIKTGVDGNNAGIGKWADSFYGKLKGGILSDNTFHYENGGIVYTNPSVTVKSGTWDGKCMEDRELEAGIYSFGSDGWRVHADSIVYYKGNFYASDNAMYFFTKE